jgi:hypothetical protein
MKTFHWGWRIGIVYSVFALATLGFVAFAFTNRVDLVRNDYYEESLRQDDIMAARERAAAASSTVESAGTSVIIRPGVSPDADIEVRFYRADEPSLDRTLTVRAQTDGTATVDCSDMRAGRWTVTCIWTVGSKSFRIERVIVLG